MRHAVADQVVEGALDASDPQLEKSTRRWWDDLQRWHRPSLGARLLLLSGGATYNMPLPGAAFSGLTLPTATASRHPCSSTGDEVHNQENDPNEKQNPGDLRRDLRHAEEP